VANILLIDDDPEFGEELHNQVHEQLKHEVLCRDNAEEGLCYLSENTNAVDLVLLDNLMPRMSGLEFLTGMKERGLRIPVILMTSAYNDGTVIDAIKGGAFKYVTKPTNYNDIPCAFFSLIQHALEVHSAPIPPPKPDKGNDADESLIKGSSPAIQAVLVRIGQLVCLDESVLILGETGTGKELVARAIHKHSPRSAAPCLAISCPSIPEQLLESELFGHEKGAFTGADRRRIGKFEHCNGGTLFLDEIGDMPRNTQSKLLRVLQEQNFERVGGNETIKTNVRIVAATNVDLKTASAAGRFRPDLYYRLNVFTINMPPLRERGDDLQLLAQHFVRRFSRELGRDVRDVSPEAMDALRRYSWPGNIRELQSVLKQALLDATGPVLLRSFLPRLVAPDANAEAVDKDAALAGLRRAIHWAWKNDKKDLWPTLEALLQRELLRYAQAQPKESEVKLAERLGMARGTLRARLQELEEPADEG
jgi:DNA-binding NtrC family response regulator